MESTTVNKENVHKVLHAIFDACEEVATAIRDVDCAVGVEQNNVFGDNQLHIDVLADKHIFDHLKKTGLVNFACSEETPEPHYCGGKEFIVTFDPLDGSSIIDVNWTVGTIFAIWPNKNDLQGLTGHDIITSGIVIYGPRTSVVYYDLEDGKVNEYKLHYKDEKMPESTWVKMKTGLQIKPTTKICAPGNFRALSESKAYIEAFDYWRKNKYVLRYIGGMAPDCYAIFIKSGGIFAALTSKSCPPKLRLLYECQPIGFIIEKAGGKTTDGEKSVLDIVINGYQQKTTFACGSSEEIDRINKFWAAEQAELKRQAAEAKTDEKTDDKTEVKTEVKA